TQIGWGRGNSDKGWREGDWQPVKLVINNVQTDYPNLSGFPDIYIGWHFTIGKDDIRFVDLVRDIQVGEVDLTDEQGWPQSGGSPYPTGPSPLPTLAAVHTAQTSTGQNIWTGFTDLQAVASVNYPEGPTDSSLGTRPGTTTDDAHQFMVPAADIVAAVSSTADTIVIYMQAHLSRTFVWKNALESQYNTAPYDAWGGDLYGDPVYATDSRLGSGYGSGSSTHMFVLMTGQGKITCQLPIPPRPGGEICGLKWHDLNANHMKDDEPELSGWRVYLVGIDPEGLVFPVSVLTGDTDHDGIVDAPDSGAYCFLDLTEALWYVSEDTDRDDPATTGWLQTYPHVAGIIVPPAANSTETSSFPAVAQPAGVADWGWTVNLTETNIVQGDVNFGNFQGVGNTTVTISANTTQIYS
ncbi:MAG: hypothetical protein KAX25_00620, partial [Dehalococcoidia bacterium]|nr:hypothetical protein [Dehalococcoidia bacterium]